MKRLLVLLVTVSAAAAPLFAVQPAKGEWTGYITDTHCGLKGATKDHTAACVEKCMRGGSKAQIWNEADNKAYDLKGYDKVKALVGSRVTVKGTLDDADAEAHTITVESAARAANAPKAPARR